MHRDPLVDDLQVAPGPDRFRTSESYIHWDRGLAIVAGMIGIVLLFLLLFVLLPIREAGDGNALTGLAVRPAQDEQPSAGGQSAAEQAAAPAARATAAAPPVGPDVPRVNATVREYPNVRGGPGENWAIRTNLRQGQRVEVVGRSPDRRWYQIVLPDNPRERGWVSQDYLTVEGNADELPEVRE